MVEPPSSAAIREHLAKLLSSPSIAGAERLSSLLRFIVEETLNGRQARLKEMRIGLDVFGRKADSYDPAFDPIVRVQMGRLRSKLRAYYNGPGVSDGVRIDVPLGSYVPAFSTFVAGPHARTAPEPTPRPADDQRIAVLPVVNMSADQENQYFCDGLTEELINHLAQIPQLRVVARTSTFQFKDAARDVREVGRLLDVSKVLEGSVRKSGDRVRVTVQLINVADGCHLWSERYEGDLEGLLLDGLRLIGSDVRGRSVLLKPNLVEFFRGSSINTDPRMVVAAADAFRQLGASSVVVAEGPGHRRDTEAVVIASGLRDALDDAKLPFVDLNDAPLVRTPLRTRFTGLKELWVPRVLRDTEVVISMPKLKTHHWVGVTLSLKNCFGCMPGRVYGWPKDVFHVNGIPESIVDIAAAVRPSLAIIDGIVGMQGDGPINGEAVQSGVVVLSRDPVAADVTGARLMGMDPEKVEYLMNAGRFLGQSRSELIEQRGEDPGSLARSFRPAPGFDDLVA